MARPPMTQQEKTQSEMIHRFVLGVLSAFTEDDFKNIVKYNIDLFKSFNIETIIDNDNIKNNRVVDIIRSNKNRIEEYLNKESMYEQMADHRPDLLRVFKTHEGELYLDNMIEKLNTLLKKLI